MFAGYAPRLYSNTPTHTISCIYHTNTLKIRKKNLNTHRMQTQQQQQHIYANMLTAANIFTVEQNKSEF